MARSRHFDFAVVGAGSAGAILASRLSEDESASVLLIEAGPDYPDFAELPDELKYGRATAAYADVFGHLWAYQARATEHSAPSPLPRGKVVGGTSAVNGQVFLRALRADFDRWSAASGGVWGLDQVLPALLRLENDLDFTGPWHGNDGPIAVRRYDPEEWLPPQAAFVEACRSRGHADCPDANIPDARGVGPVPFNNVGGIRGSTAVTYLAEARGRPNLTILPDTFVRRLLLTGSRVIGLEIEGSSGHGAEEVVSAGEYLICAGSIGSPHLLMVSGIGHVEALRKAGIDPRIELPAVGGNLADHALVDLVWESGRDAGETGAASPRVQVALRYTAPGSETADDMQITPRNSAPGHRGATVSLVPSLELPRSTGGLTAVSADPRVQPAIDLGFLREHDDIVRLREGALLALELAEAPAFATILRRRLDPAPSDLSSTAALDGWILRRVRTSHHSCGTCRMGADPDESVVDASGRVHGIDNLRVADASIFPSIIGANLNATAMLVGERVAELARVSA